MEHGNIKTLSLSCPAGREDQPKHSALYSPHFTHRYIEHSIGQASPLLCLAWNGGQKRKLCVALVARPAFFPGCAAGTPCTPEPAGEAVCVSVCVCVFVCVCVCVCVFCVCVAFVPCLS